MKIDIIIKGNLLCNNKLLGGVILCREISSDYDISEAAIFEGDIIINSFDAKGKTVLVTGIIATLGKEGDYADK